MAPSATDISVVVPVRDGAKTLPALLASLGAQTLGQERFETIVVDNGSRDRSAEVAAAAGATVVTEPEPNRAAARNRGAAQASAALLAFTDADCRADPAWLESLLACLGERPLAAGPIGLVTGEPPSDLERLEQISRFDQERAVSDSGWAASANLGIRRQVFEAIGGFDASYRHIGEDVDLCLRAGRAGHPLGFCPGAGVAHQAESRLTPVLRRAFRHGYSSTQLRRRFAGEVGRTYWRHPGPLIRGDWGLHRFGVDGRSLPPRERRVLVRLARLEYAARMAGSLSAGLRRAR